MNIFHAFVIIATVVALLMRQKYHTLCSKCKFPRLLSGLCDEGARCGAASATCDRFLRKREDPQIIVDNEYIGTMPHE